MLRRLLLVVAFGLFSTQAFAAAINVTIDLSDQRMYVSVSGTHKYTWKISTARAGYVTPKGTFQPQRMYEEYYSIKYDFAPMPWSIFFYGGYAIHGTTEIDNLGTPASHGCVRLHPDNAHRLFDLVKANGMSNTSIRVQA